MRIESIQEKSDRVGLAVCTEYGRPGYGLVGVAPSHRARAARAQGDVRPGLRSMSSSSPAANTVLCLCGLETL